MTLGAGARGDHDRSGLADRRRAPARQARARLPRRSRRARPRSVRDPGGGAHRRPGGRDDGRRPVDAQSAAVVRIADCNWMQVEEYLEHDDRAVLPVGSTEQHAYLSLATDSILAERVAVEAAEPLGVLVLPAMPFGIAPGFAAFPGTVSLRPETLVAVLVETLGTLHGQGFRRFLIVNGHGGNTPARAPLEAWGARWHDWWDSAAVRAEAAAVYPGDATHASWFESFPWTASRGRGAPHGGEADGHRPRSAARARAGGGTGGDRRRLVRRPIRGPGRGGAARLERRRDGGPGADRRRSSATSRTAGRASRRSSRPVGAAGEAHRRGSRTARRG